MAQSTKNKWGSYRKRDSSSEANDKLYTREWNLSGSNDLTDHSEDRKLSAGCGNLSKEATGQSK